MKYTFVQAYYKDMRKKDQQINKSFNHRVQTFLVVIGFFTLGFYFVMNIL